MPQQGQVSPSPVRQPSAAPGSEDRQAGRRVQPGREPQPRREVFGSIRGSSVAREVFGSIPGGGKGAQGASTGLDWPRAGLERRLSAATQSDAAPFFWLHCGSQPLSRLGRGGFCSQRCRGRLHQRWRHGFRHGATRQGCYSLSLSPSLSLCSDR